MSVAGAAEKAHGAVTFFRPTLCTFHDQYITCSIQNKSVHNQSVELARKVFTEYINLFIRGNELNSERAKFKKLLADRT